MTIKDVKGKWLYHKNEKVFVSDYIFYEGTGEYKVYLVTGFGADERKNNLTFDSEQEMTEWLSKFNTNKMETKKEVVSLEESRSEENGMESVSMNLNALLIKTIEDVREGRIPVEQAKAVSMLGQTLINSTRVQVEILKLGK